METQTEKRIETGVEPQGRSALPRKLGLISAIAVVIGSTIGSGIFRSPAGIAQRIPDENIYLLIWVLGGFFTLCGALTVAELAGALPQTGGIFVYLREGWGRLPAFLFGWSELLIVRASALGALSTVFAEYFLRLINVEGAGARRAVAASAIVLVATFNIVGVKLGALVQTLTAATKYLALVLLVLAAFLIGGQHPVEVSAPAASSQSPFSIIMFGLAFISLLWVYDGWADVSYLSGEVKRPERFLPIAIIAGTLAVIAIYLLANLAYLHLLDINQIAGSKLVAAEAAKRIVGNVGEKLISIAVMISTFGALNGSMLTGPRIVFAMANSGLFFKKIASVHPRFKTPYVAISLAATLAIVFLMVRTFEQLTDTFVLAIWPFYAGGVAAVYILRRKRPDLPRPYRTLGYPITPALFILAVMILLGNALWSDFNNLDYYRALFSGEQASTGGSGALLVFSIILAGVPVYLIWKKKQDASVSIPRSPERS